MRINNPFVITPNSVFTAAIQNDAVTIDKLFNPGQYVGGFYKATSSATFIAPYTKEYHVLLVGGGGGGAGGGGTDSTTATFGFGGAGGCSSGNHNQLQNLVGGQSYIFTIGVGGSGGAGGSGNTVGMDGGSGGDTIFNFTHTAFGGVGGIHAPGSNVQIYALTCGGGGVGLNAAPATRANYGGVIGANGNSGVSRGGGGGGGQAGGEGSVPFAGGAGAPGNPGYIYITW